MTSTIILNPGPNGKLHKPEESLGELVKGSISTNAATSLSSGPFQYVNSNFLAKATRFLSNVASTAFDKESGQLFLLRRSDPVVVVLDNGGTVTGEWTAADTGIQTGQSIKTKWFGTTPVLTVWVVDLQASCIRIYDQTGWIVKQIGPQVDSVTFGKVTDIAWDSLNNLYITDGDTGGQYNRVVVLNSIWSLLAVWGGTAPSPDPGAFDSPHAVAVDVLFRVWVVDSMNSRVQVLSSAGIFLKEWVYPGLKLYGITISTILVNSDSKSAMVYVSANSMADPTGKTGQLLLIPARMDPADTSNIGPGIPLVAWSIPGMLHSVTTTETADNKLIISTLDTMDAPVFQLSAPRPVINGNPTRHGPVWPAQFTADLLLHPFVFGQLPQVAHVTYIENQMIQFDLYTLIGMGLSKRFELSQGKTSVFFGATPTGPWRGPFDTTMVVPAHDWLVSSKISFQGESPLMSISNNWWCEQLADENKTTNWYWFRNDTNAPFRIMNSTPSNPNNLAVLGEYAFIYWTNFQVTSPLSDFEKPINDMHTSLSSTDGVLAQITDIESTPDLMKSLDDLIGTDTCPLTPNERAKNIELIQTLIPGLTPGDDGLPLPVWPETFNMTCIMTPVNRKVPMPTQVLYSWPTVELRTRMFNSDLQSAIDAVENSVGTYQTLRNADGSCSPIGNMFPGLAPPNPAWAASGGGKIVATIANNPDFSPNGTTTRIFNEDMGDDRQFWIWYSNADPNNKDTPVVFMETEPPASEGTSLALADYKVMEQTSLIDPNSYTVSPPWPAEGK